MPPRHQLALCLVAGAVTSHRLVELYLARILAFDRRAGRLYLRLYTRAHPTGAIRAQLVPKSH